MKCRSFTVASFHAALTAATHVFPPLFTSLAACFLTTCSYESAQGSTAELLLCCPPHPWRPDHIIPPICSSCNPPPSFHSRPAIPYGWCASMTQWPWHFSWSSTAFTTPPHLQAPLPSFTFCIPGSTSSLETTSVKGSAYSPPSTSASFFSTCSFAGVSLPSICP